MYNYTVPIDTFTFTNLSDKKKVVNTLHEMGVSRVMVGIGPYYFDHDKRKLLLASLKESCEYLHNEGFEVGAWTWTFMDVRADSGFFRMRTISGKESSQSVCPSDSDFRKLYAEYLCELADCGVDLIMFDDDFRYGNQAGSVGCVCDNHLAYMSELLGEKVTLETLDGKLIEGSTNKYRSAWIKSKRHFFELFASEMREALDKVAPHVRLGFCSSYCSWSQDGITPYELSKILAGNTKPFFRLCGAPFWVGRDGLSGFAIQDIIEFARFQVSLRGEDDKNTEAFGEGDTWPRPRWISPANYLEGFDQALRISGGSDGILKYMMEYTPSERHETGYCDIHIKNLPIYEKADKMFADKECIGVRIFEYLGNYENSDIPTYLTTEKSVEFLGLPYTSRMLAAASVPGVYGDADTVGIVFGENAKYLPREALKNGLILDARAAEILTERGIDVGLVKKGDRMHIAVENFAIDNEMIPVSGFAYELTIKDIAKVESRFITYDATGMTLSSPVHNIIYTGDRNDIVGSYTYENADGERFLVFAFDGGVMPDNLFRDYSRADQLKRVLPYLGKTYGFTICTAPHLYTIAKRKDNKTAVALWNFCIDSVEEPTIRLDNKNARIVSTIGCEAKLSDGVITLSRIEPFGFAAVEFAE